MVYGLRDGGKIATYTKGVDESMRTMAECVNPGPHFLLEVIPARAYVCSPMLVSQYETSKQ
jgi:hypothetical protein